MWCRGVMEDLPVNASYSLLNRIDALLINDQQGADLPGMYREREPDVRRLLCYIPE